MLFRITVVKCTDLPPMDANGLSDGFCELWVVNSKTNKYLEPPKNQNEIKRTQIVMKNLNPVFNETFEFDFSEKLKRREIDFATRVSEEDDIDDDYILDDPMDNLLMIRIVDYDKFTKNDGMY